MDPSEGDQAAYSHEDDTFWRTVLDDDVWDFRGLRMSKIENINEGGEFQLQGQLFFGILYETLLHAEANAERGMVQNNIKNAVMMLQAIDSVSIQQAIGQLPNHGWEMQNLHPESTEYLILLTNPTESVKASALVLNHHMLIQFVDHVLNVYYQACQLDLGFYQGFPKVMMHVILKFLLKYNLQYNSKLIERIFSLKYTAHVRNRESSQKTTMNKRLITSVYTALVRRNAQDIDKTRFKSGGALGWHFNDSENINPLVWYLKGYQFVQPDAISGVDQDYYCHTLKQRLEAYQEISQNPDEIADYISVDGIIADGECIAQAMRVDPMLTHILTRLAVKETHPSALATEFIKYTLLFASNLVAEKGPHTKEHFINQRLAEIIRANPRLDDDTFTKKLKSELDTLQVGLYGGSSVFATNLSDSLMRTADAMMVLKHNESNPPERIHHDEPEEAGIMPEDIMQDDAVDHPVPDFVSRPQRHAPNRFEGPSRANENKTINQKPFFPVEPSTDDDERSDRELLNAAKRNAQHEYYKQMTTNGTSSRTGGLDISLQNSVAFVNAEKKLSEIRGSVMRKIIALSEKKTDPELIPIAKDGYTNYVIEMGVYLHADNDTITPLHQHPIKRVAAKDQYDIFDDITDLASLTKVVSQIQRQAWEQEWAATRKPHSAPPDGVGDINPDEIVKVIHAFLQRNHQKTLRQSGANGMTIGSSFRDWDATGRTEFKELDTTVFQYHGRPASFQIALNIPQFTHRELFQSMYTLQKANLDLREHIKQSFLQFVDLKVRLVTAGGHNIELVWTIHKHTPDHFHLMHVAYRSVTPRQTLLTPPESLNQIALDPSDIVPDSVRLAQTKIKDDMICRADEMKLVQLHAQGIRGFTEGVSVDTNLKSFGFIYTYEFWTLIGTCFQIGAAAQKEFLTCYTIVHRNSEFAQLKERKRPRDRIDEGAPPVHRQPPQHVRRAQTTRAAPRGDNWFVFGTCDRAGTETYRFTQGPANSLRAELIQTTNIFQTKVYRVFYPETVRQSAEAGITLTQHIRDRLDVELGTGTIVPWQGLFATWMRMHPAGERPDTSTPVDGKYHTANQYWTSLWETYVREHPGFILYEFNLVQQGTDERIEALKKLYVRSAAPEAPAAHHWPGSGDEGRHPRSQYPWRRDTDPSVSQWPTRTPPHPPNTADTGGGRGVFMPQPSRGNAAVRGRGAAWHGAGNPRPSVPPPPPPPRQQNYWHNRGRGRGSSSSANPIPHLSEDQQQIPQMQHEIDSLRRSLNQLALLQA